MISKTSPIFCDFPQCDAVSKIKIKYFKLKKKSPQQKQTNKQVKISNSFEEKKKLFWEDFAVQHRYTLKIKWQNQNWNLDSLSWQGGSNKNKNKTYTDQKSDNKQQKKLGKK